MPLSDEQIGDIWKSWPRQSITSARLAKEFARAIESAATAPLLEQIAELEEKVKAAEQASRWESDLCAQALDSMKQLEAQLTEARKDAEQADGMIKSMAAVIDKDDARWKFLHTINKDAQGFEWCVLRVKWENGRISEAWHTNSNLSDLDAVIAQEQ